MKVFWTLKLGRCRPQFTLRNSGRPLGESGECVGKWQSSCILFKGTSINLYFVRMQSSGNTGLHFVRNLSCHYIWNLDLQSVFEIRLGNDWEGHANLKLCIVKQKIDYGVPREMASVFHHSHVATQLCTFCSLWLTLHPCLVSVLVPSCGALGSLLCRGIESDQIVTVFPANVSFSWFSPFHNRQFLFACTFIMCLHLRTDTAKSLELSQLRLCSKFAS